MGIMVSQMYAQPNAKAQTAAKPFRGPCPIRQAIHIPPATALVEKARAYIAKHACDGIRPNDVIAHVGVSRSLLNLRFRQVCGKSVNEDILDIRLAEVRRQLEKTKHTILQIGRDCGFNDPDHLKRVFKKRFGTSMRLYRNTYRSSDVRKQPCH